jgi:hypothetical protein
MGHSITAGAVVALTLLSSAVAAADDELIPTPQPAEPAGPVQPSEPQPVEPQPVDTQQHNVTYRARVDGLARGALITYRISDTQVNSADPTMLPGRTFETTAVLTDAKEAGMRISIQWPYSANLHCEILVDDQMVVQADQFIGPRALPARDDPDYGAMNCGAPLSNALGAPASTLPLPPVAPDPAGLPPADIPATDLGAPVS